MRFGCLSAQQAGLAPAAATTSIAAAPSVRRAHAGQHGHGRRQPADVGVIGQPSGRRRHDGTDGVGPESPSGKRLADRRILRGGRRRRRTRTSDGTGRAVLVAGRKPRLGRHHDQSQ
jgi:hypothetical protein